MKKSWGPEVSGGPTLELSRSDGHGDTFEGLLGLSRKITETV